MECTELYCHGSRLVDELCQAATGHIVDQRRGTVGNGLLHVRKLDTKILRRDSQSVDLFGCVMPSLRQMRQAFGKLAGSLDEGDDTADGANHLHGFWVAVVFAPMELELLKS